jgi:hypothetical protein
MNFCTSQNACRTKIVELKITHECEGREEPKQTYLV